MPQFVYDTRPSPIVGTIGDLMLRSGDIEAQRAKAIADAQAAATVGSADAWSRAYQNLGNTVTNAVQQQTDPRQQMARMQLTTAKHEQAGQQTMADLMAAPPPAQGPVEPGGEAPPSTNPYLKKEGDVSVWDAEGLSKAMAAKGFGDLTPKVIADIGGLNDAHRKEAQARQQFGQAQANVLAKGAGTALSLLRDHPTADPAMVVGFIGEQMAANGTFPPDKIAAVKQQLLSDPTQLHMRLELMSKAGTQAPVTLKDKEKLLNPNDLGGAPIADNTDPNEGGYTINGQRFKKDGTPIGAAVPKQVEPPKVGSEEDFVTTYAKEKFSKPAAALTVAEKSEALGAFKAANADQEVRAAALAQKNLATVLEQMRAGQQPTAEDAKTVADDLVNHRQSPSQVKLMFGTRGVEGQAFMLKVNTEARKLDPSFNYEEAESNYQLAKSTGFQNTVRYMDSALESIPRLEQNAKNLGNGSFRTLNQIANAAKDQFNSTDLKRFKTDALLVGDEVAKILSGGGTGSATSDAKLKQATDIIGVSDSVPAIAAAMQEVQALMGNRRRALTRGTYMEGASAAKPAADPGAKATAPHALGDVVMVNGQKVRVTKLLPNGKYEGQVVP